MTYLSPINTIGWAAENSCPSQSCISWEAERIVPRTQHKYTFTTLFPAHWIEAYAINYITNPLKKVYHEKVFVVCNGLHGHDVDILCSGSRRVSEF